MQKELSYLKQQCKKFKVLYIEDEEKVRLQTSKVLSLYFDDITLAKNGKEGLEKFKKEKYDIIFTDINMPVMDGLSMLEHIRTFDKNIFIGVFSAYDKTKYLLKSIELDVDAYILKPFNFNDFQKAIKKIIDKRSQNKQKDEILKLKNNISWFYNKSALYKDKKHIYLTKNETILMKLLCSSKERLFTSEEIELEIFDDEYNDNKRVRGLISRFNKKIGTKLIESVYAQGYKLNLGKQ